MEEKKSLTKQEEIKALNKLFDSDTYFAATFLPVRDAMMEAFENDELLLARCNPMMLGFTTQAELDAARKELEKLKADNKSLNQYADEQVTVINDMRAINIKLEGDAIAAKKELEDEKANHECEKSELEKEIKELNNALDKAKQETENGKIAYAVILDNCAELKREIMMRDLQLRIARNPEYQITEEDKKLIMQF